MKEMRKTAEEGTKKTRRKEEEKSDKEHCKNEGKKRMKVEGDLCIV